MEILQAFFEARFNREIGKTNRIYNKVFVNSRVNYKYVFLAKSSKYPIEYYPSLISLEQEYVRNLDNRLPIEVFEQLVFSLIKIFEFSKRGNFVNQRLSFFLFYTICSLQLDQKEYIFTQLLYFLQNSEYFIDKVKFTENTFFKSNKRD